MYNIYRFIHIKEGGDSHSLWWEGATACCGNKTLQAVGGRHCLLWVSPSTLSQRFRLEEVISLDLWSIFFLTTITYL